MDGDALLRKAGLAMKQAKRSAPGGVQHYTDAMHQVLKERFAAGNRLRDALEANDFCLYYLPIVKLPGADAKGPRRRPGRSSGRGPVALAAGRRPLLHPAAFLRSAEESGHVVEIGNWVLRRACEHAAAWRRSGLPAISVAVNLSVRQIRRSTFLTLVESILAETGVQPSLLEVELAKP